MKTRTLDRKEEKALKYLNEEYKKFVEPNKFDNAIVKVKETGEKYCPQKMKDYFSSIGDSINEADIWNKAMEMATSGFTELQKISARYSIDENKIIESMKKINHEVHTFDDFCKLKSYEIEKVVISKDFATHMQNIVQAGSTGALGMAGLPFNIVLSTFIQFRTVQQVALHYGYDVINEQKEMEFAGDVLTTILSKGKAVNAEGYGELITKMMVQAELSSLKKALTSKTMTQMASEGGLKLVYVQIRAIGHAAAKKALNKSAKKEIENNVVRKILESFSRKMTVKTTSGSIWGLSAILNILFDTHQISRVIKMSNVIYQKRFLIDVQLSNIDDNDIVDVEI